MALLSFNLTRNYFNDSSFENLTTVNNGTDIDRKYTVLLKEWHVVMIAVLAALAAIAMVGIVLVTHYYNILQKNRRRNENGSPRTRAKANQPVTVKLKRLCHCFGTKKISQTNNHNESSFVKQPNALVPRLHPALDEPELKDNHESLVPRLPPIRHGGLVSQQMNKKENDDYASLSTIYTQMPENHNHPMNNNVFRMQPITKSKIESSLNDVQEF